MKVFHFCLNANFVFISVRRKRKHFPSARRKWKKPTTNSPSCVKRYIFFRNIPFKSLTLICSDIAQTMYTICYTIIYAITRLIGMIHTTHLKMLRALPRVRLRDFHSSITSAALTRIAQPYMRLNE